MSKEKKEKKEKLDAPSMWSDSVNKGLDARERTFERVVEESKRVLRDGTVRGDDVAEKATLILGACAARVWRLPTTHLRRVGVTLGVLQAVRGGLRFINGERKGFRQAARGWEVQPILWSGTPETLELIDSTSTEVAAPAYEGLFEALKDQSDAFGPRLSDFPALRSDLRFAEQMKGTAAVPFGPSFPEVKPHDIPLQCISKMKADIAEMSSLGLKRLHENNQDSAAKNLVNLLIVLATLGKCAMCQWSLEHGQFLDCLACVSEDQELSEPS